MAYPTDKPSGNYKLRDSNFAELDTNKIPMDNGLWKTGYKNAEESEVESVPDAHEQNWLFDVLHRNLKYTQDTAEENKRLLETKVATPTNIGQVKIGYGLEITASGVLSVSKSVAEDANIISYDLPVGSYMLWSGKYAPEYFIIPSGQTLLRSSYPELWEYAQENDLVGTLFGSGNGSTTFTVTDIQDSLKDYKYSVDWSLLENKSLDTDHIATSDGYVYLSTGYAGATSGTSRMYINGKEVAYQFVTQAGLADSMGWMPVAKGDTYRASCDVDKNNATHFYFIPNKKGNEENNMKDIGLKFILKALPTPPSNAVPTGTILDYTGSSAPDGYIIANGAELSRTTFNRLYQWALANNLVKDQSTIPSTAHGFYGTGDGSTTFTIPDLRGVFKRNADLASNRGGSSLGGYQADGLPNITGQFNAHNTDATGAFWQISSGQWHGNRNNNGQKGIVGFNASRSNGIYGRASQVQPKSVAIIPILKY